MRIIFDLRNTGLGNGGGSETIIKSVNILSELNQNIMIIDSGKNKNTWTKLNVEHKIIKNINQIPNSDVIISTGYKSVFQTMKIPDNKIKLKIHWMRGFENWVLSENDIINKIFRSPLIKVVNGICLQNKLKKYNIDSYLIRPGNNLNDFSNLNIRDKNKIVIGGLYHIKHKTKRSDLIIKITKKLKSKYNNIELHMFGTSNDPNIKEIDKYIKQPNINEKNLFYNNVDVWLSTSELDSLHIPPQEAMLCGCCVIGNNSEMNGTLDYLINNHTGLICKNKIDKYIKNIEILINDKDLRNKLSINGKNKIIELGDRKKNMIEFIKLMEKLM